MNIVLKLFRIRLKTCSFTIMLMTLLKIIATTTHSHMIVLILEYGSASKNLFIAFLMPHCPVTVVQRYRDGVCSLLFHLFFVICHPYIPLHLEEMIFLILVYLYTKRLQ